MSALVFVGVCLAGGVGAALRFTVDDLIRRRLRASFPFGTSIINVTGSLILGFITGLTVDAASAPAWALILGTGMMGGYTTFSTASVETMRLVQERDYTLALTNGFAVLVATVVCGLGGFWIGSAL